MVVLLKKTVHMYEYFKVRRDIATVQIMNSCKPKPRRKGSKRWLVLGICVSGKTVFHKCKNVMHKETQCPNPSLKCEAIEQKQRILTQK